MKSFLFISFLVPFSTAIGQSISAVQTLLEKKDLTAFNKFIGTRRQYANEITFWNTFRTVTGNFKEGVATYYCLAEKKDSIPTDHQQYRIKLLSLGDIIFYYEIQKMAWKKGVGGWRGQFQLLTDYSNRLTFKEMENSFDEQYVTRLNRSELFIDTISYGVDCRLFEERNFRSIVDSIVENKNVTMLMELLKSTNLEKQVYAIDGFYKLHRNGLILDNETKR